MDMVDRFEVYWTHFDPAHGSELGKTRPAVVVSDPVMNRALNTVIVVPLTSTTKGYPSRLALRFNHKQGELVFDQIRAIDKNRLQGKLGNLSVADELRVCDKLVEMFSL